MLKCLLFFGRRTVGEAIMVSGEQGKQKEQDIEFLRERAASLPMRPGVYLMKDKNDRIIYVGKSRVLRQRVSQYFQDTEHDVKTTRMVQNVRNFEWMLTDSEMEALSLENRLIKLHMPKFNIKLKDGRNYPYLKMTVNEEYPRLLVVRKRLNDGAKYFGPYSGSGVAYTLLKTLQKNFRIASCNKSFPRDIGKVRPCLYRQLGQCAAPCTGELSGEEYAENFREAILFLRGDIGGIKKTLTEKMEFAAENLMFEAAALYRDRIAAMDAAWQRQKVLTSPDVEQDVFALYEGEVCSCLTVLYIRGGSLIDRENFIFEPEQLAGGEGMVSFLSDLYAKREYIPREILLNMELPESELTLLGDYLRELAGYRVRVTVPERGEKKQLCEMAQENSEQYARQYVRENEKQEDVLIRLAQLLKLEVVPQHIEAFDISNLGAERIVAGMIRIDDAKFAKGGYRTYNIKPDGKPDDYASMREALERRLNHPEVDYPDLILLDGGRGHVSTVRALMDEMGIDIPVFGMVKDDFHKTRALTTDTEEISIAREQAVFVFIYKIQEEVHRYTISRMSAGKEKTMRRSSLEDIRGIGAAKAAKLLGHFGTLARLKAAGEEEIAAVKGVSEADAQAVYAYFRRKETEKEK